MAAAREFESLSPPQPPSSSPSIDGRMRQTDGGDSEEELQQQVMSEIHLGCPPRTSGPHISRFTICLPPEVECSRCKELFKDEAIHVVNPTITLDEDGDLVLQRRARNRVSSCFLVTIQHKITSSIPNVGLQVWRAELVLSDFVLHKMCTSSELDGIVSLELGAGTGLVGMLLARVAQTVFLTDLGDEILDNCARNVSLNSGLFSSRAAVHVRELNWMDPWPPKSVLDNNASLKKYSWTSSELEAVQGASLIIAADVIYCDDLTDALFSILERLLSAGSEKVLYLALEKRYNFSLDDLDVVANGYSRFRGYLRLEGEHECSRYGRSPCFVGKRIDLTQIPQYVMEYERGQDVELWQIRYNRKKK